LPNNAWQLLHASRITVNVHFLTKEKARKKTFTMHTHLLCEEGVSKLVKTGKQSTSLIQATTRVCKHSGCLQYKSIDIVSKPLQADNTKDRSLATPKLQSGIESAVPESCKGRRSKLTRKQLLSTMSKEDQQQREVLALVSWLQTFDQFPYSVVDGLEGENVSERFGIVLDSLENVKISK